MPSSKLLRPVRACVATLVRVSALPGTLPARRKARCPIRTSRRVSPDHTMHRREQAQAAHVTPPSA
eukprot:5116409-Prymnesium_polylepis.1